MQVEGTKANLVMYKRTGTTGRYVYHFFLYVNDERIVIKLFVNDPEIRTMTLTRTNERRIHLLMKTLILMQNRRLNSETDLMNFRFTKLPKNIFVRIHI